MSEIVIRRERPEDYAYVENMTREAFWNVYRPGCSEHYLLHTYRDDPDFIPELDLVMELDGQIIGHVMYVRSQIKADDGRVIPIVTFGPISIAPEWQKKGYGKRLVEQSMQRAAQWGAGAVAITGSNVFYGKCGFVIAHTRGIRYENNPTAPYFLIAELKPGFLDGITGTFRDPDGYDIDEDKALEYDAAFPPKVRLKLPGQLE